jgi:hypothetical protein
MGEEVRHKDGIKTHNDWKNLHYGTGKDQYADRVIHGTDQVGENNPNVLLTWEKVREIRAKWTSGEYTVKDLVLEYGVSKGHIYRIVNNLAWVE